MTTISRKQDVEHWIAKFMQSKTVRNTRNLAQRLQEGGALRQYLTRRRWLVIPVVALIALISIVCTAATFLYLGRVHPLLVLPAIITAPVFLVGSAFVLLYAFLHWIEGRIMIKAINRRAKTGGRMRASWLKRTLGIDMSPFPPVPWVIAAITLVVPLAMLTLVSWKATLAVVVVAMLMPVIYARLEN